MRTIATAAIAALLGIGAGWTIRPVPEISVPGNAPARFEQGWGYHVDIHDGGRELIAERQ
jgi:hypothetical protein